jgi:LAGLIDADG DNA endonuclease family protein
MAHVRRANALKAIKILPTEMEVIIGSLIGDGSLTKSGKHYRLRIGHTMRHRDYVEWKYQLLKRLCITSPQNVPTTKSVRFGTVGHPELSQTRYQWYDKNQVKFIPQDFRLTPLMLAIWFMDDGCKHGNTVDFSVHCFSVRCINILRRAMTEFGIVTTVNFDGKGHRIYIRRSSYASFKALVKPYIQPCMAYKLP